MMGVLLASCTFRMGFNWKLRLLEVVVAAAGIVVAVVVVCSLAVASICFGSEFELRLMFDVVFVAVVAVVVAIVIAVAIVVVVFCVLVVVVVVVDLPAVTPMLSSTGPAALCASSLFFVQTFTKFTVCFSNLCKIKTKNAYTNREKKEI